MRKIMKKMVFGLMLLSNISNVACGTIQEERLKQEKRDVKASGARLGEKIAIGIGLGVLCYIWYSWRAYSNKSLEVKLDFKQELIYSMVREAEAKDKEPKTNQEKLDFLNRNRDALIIRRDTEMPSESILTMAKDTERVKIGDDRNPFKKAFRNMGNDNYPMGNFLRVNDDNGNLSGNEVFVDEPILQQRKQPKIDKQRSSSVMLESAFSGGVSSVLKNKRRLSVNKEEQAKPKSRPKRNKYKKRSKKVRSNSVAPRPAECKGMTKAELSRWAVNKKREQLKKMRAKQLQDAKDHKAKTNVLNKKRKELNPDATTIRHSIVDKIIDDDNNK